MPLSRAQRSALAVRCRTGTVSNSELGTAPDLRRITSLRCLLRRVRGRKLSLRQQLSQRALDLLGLERLLQSGAVAIGFGQTAFAVAADENKRHAALGQDIRHRINLLSGDVDVEDGAMQIGRRRKFGSFGEVPTAPAIS